jgi:site-specific recombinase XerD
MLEKLTKRVIEALEVRQKPYEVRDSELRGLLLRVQPSGIRAWYFDYRHKGTRNRRLIGRYPGLSAEGARGLCLKLAGKAADGIDLQHEKRQERAQTERARQGTLQAFLENRYEPWARAHLKSAEFQIARLRSDFAEWLEKPMHEIGPFAIEGMRQRWKKAGMQPRSINRDVQRLQSVLSRAVEWRILDRHPLEGLKPLKADKTGRVRFLSADEEAALRTALGTREQGLRQARARFNAWRVARGKKPLPEREGDYLDHLRPLVMLALNTGLRRGELLGLTWGSVNFDARLLTVTAATAKSGHTRRIPLNREAFEVLEIWRDRQRKPAGSALVFPGAEGERMKRIDTSWESLMKAAGLKNFRLHDCRHHFASTLVQAGVDLYTVKELLGHSEIAMTERYSHLAPHNLRAAVEKVAG